jgi:hypothetical protein
MAKVRRDEEHILSYNLMLEQVAEYNPDAAWFIEESAKRGLAKRTGCLTYCFTFANTPQRREFWVDICSNIERGWDNDDIGFEYDAE